MFSGLVAQKSGLSLMATPWTKDARLESGDPATRWQFKELKQILMSRSSGDTLSNVTIPEERTSQCGSDTFHGPTRSGFVTSPKGFSANFTPIFASYQPSGEHDNDNMWLWTVDSNTGLCTMTHMKVSGVEYIPTASGEGSDSPATKILIDLGISIEGTSGRLTFNAEAMGDCGEGGDAKRSVQLLHLPQCFVATDFWGGNERGLEVVFDNRLGDGSRAEWITKPKFALMLGLRELDAGGESIEGAL